MSYGDELRAQVKATLDDWERVRDLIDGTSSVIESTELDMMQFSLHSSAQAISDIPSLIAMMKRDCEIMLDRHRAIYDRLEAYYQFIGGRSGF